MALFLNPIIKERREGCQYNAIAKDDLESMEAAKRLEDRILDLYRNLKVDGQPVK